MLIYWCPKVFFDLTLLALACKIKCLTYCDKSYIGVQYIKFICTVYQIIWVFDCEFYSLKSALENPHSGTEKYFPPTLPQINANFNVVKHCTCQWWLRTVRTVHKCPKSSFSAHCTVNPLNLCVGVVSEWMRERQHSPLCALTGPVTSSGPSHYICILNIGNWKTGKLTFEDSNPKWDHLNWNRNYY